MTERVIISGFGGQGALTIGQIIAALHLSKGKNVTWMPSYGAEMRGGTANCSVIASDAVIGSPLITKNADVLILLNNPSVDKFLPAAAPGGSVIINTSIVSKEIDRSDINLIKIDATNISVELNNPKVQNMVMLGGYLRLHPEFTDAEIEGVLMDKFGQKAAKLLPLNMQAIERGKK
ncbi:MAG: 2-oxoacid:acceptor oxidoreductase family protein [Clostridiales bacterium]|jgi:2-oxoglutarate ferredoxin oxidoreductase subunit gamma|nr:2-oxoacid:acceptor oxidoreductase family protein [Clostridiales bacterium]